MLEENLPMTQENYAYALSEARRDYMEQNMPRIIEKIWGKANSYYEKFYSEHYENTGGKPKQDAKPASQASADAEYKAFKQSMLQN